MTALQLHYHVMSYCAYTVYINMCYPHAHKSQIPAFECATNQHPCPFKHTQGISSVMSPRPLPQGRGMTQKCIYKGSISLPLSVSLPPFFLSLTHTLSPFSSHLKRLPKDRNKKMNRSQRVSWQQRAVAHKHYLDQQEKVIIKA